MADAWRYAPNYCEPEAAKKLLQAVLTAYATIEFAQTKIDPENFATVPDWNRARSELLAALKAAGHPAGELQAAENSKPA